MIFGYLFLVVGVIGLLTPIPFGVVFLALSLLLLIPTSPAAAARMMRLRRRLPRFNRFLLKVSRRLPSPYRRILRRTEVDFMDQHFH